METFDYEIWKCPDCQIQIIDSELLDAWRCPQCKQNVWIYAEVNGSKYVLERVRAMDLEKDDVVLADGDSAGKKVKKVKHYRNKAKIYFRDGGVLNAKSKVLLNTIIGVWKKKEETKSLQNAFRGAVL